MSKAHIGTEKKKGIIIIKILLIVIIIVAIIFYAVSSKKEGSKQVNQDGIVSNTEDVQPKTNEATENTETIEYGGNRILIPNSDDWCISMDYTASVLGTDVAEQRFNEEEAHELFEAYCEENGNPFLDENYKDGSALDNYLTANNLSLDDVNIFTYNL